MAENGTLSPRQVRTIAALMANRNIRQAATAAKVGERTLHKWMATPAFRTALTQAEDSAIDEATRRLLNLQNDALDAVANLLEDNEASPTLKLRAAQIVFDTLLRLRNLRDIEARLSALEEHIKLTRESEQQRL